jgi:hypothetical protein
MSGEDDTTPLGCQDDCGPVAAPVLSCQPSGSGRALFAMSMMSFSDPGRIEVAKSRIVIVGSISRWDYSRKAAMWLPIPRSPDVADHCGVELQ